MKKIISLVTDVLYYGYLVLSLFLLLSSFFISLGFVPFPIDLGNFGASWFFGFSSCFACFEIAEFVVDLYRKFRARKEVSGDD